MHRGKGKEIKCLSAKMSSTQSKSVGKNNLSMRTMLALDNLSRAQLPEMGLFVEKEIKNQRRFVRIIPDVIIKAGHQVVHIIMIGIKNHADQSNEFLSKNQKLCLATNGCWGGCFRHQSMMYLRTIWITKSNRRV